jgi:hypothetical protein
MCRVRSKDQRLVDAGDDFDRFHQIGIVGDLA